MRLAVAIIVLGLALTGCAGALSGPVHDATSSAIATLDDVLVKKQIDDLVKSSTASARDVALDDETIARVHLLETALLNELRVVFGEIRNDLLKDLNARVQAIVRAAVDEALGPTSAQETAALRETLVGPDFARDLSVALSGALDDAGPHLTKALAAPVDAVKASALEDLAKWRIAAIVVGTVALALLLLHAHTIRELRLAVRMGPRGQ